MSAPTLRFARRCDDPFALAMQYCRGLGFEELGRFTGHEGYDGVMLGWADAGWHLEFTRAPDRRPAAPDAEDAIVLYCGDEAVRQERRETAIAAGFASLLALNPYWARNGHCLIDHEGFIVILALGDWRR